MAADEAEHSKPSDEPGSAPDLPHQAAVDEAGNQVRDEPQRAPADEESLAGPSSNVHSGAEEPLPADPPSPLAVENNLDPSAPEPAHTPEPRRHEPEAASSASSSSAPWRVVQEAAPPRSRFPALAATAIAGGILGFGGTFALRRFEAPPVQAVSDDRIGALSARVDAIEAKGDASPAAVSTALAALEARLTAAESTANKAAGSANSAQADLKEIASKPPPEPAAATATSPPSEAPDLEPLNARIGTIEQKLTSLEAALAAPKAELRARQQEHEIPAAKQGSHAQMVAIVAQSLLHKLESGSQFSEELATLANLGVAADSLAPLQAASIPSERQLTTQFTALAPAIIEAGAASQAGADEGFLDRVTRHAKGLVHIRRVGETEGTDTEALVARIDDALADHDLDAAYNAWKQLPSAATAKSENWGSAVKTRLDAINAARSIETDAVAVMGKPKS